MLKCLRIKNQVTHIFISELRYIRFHKESSHICAFSFPRATVNNAKVLVKQRVSIRMRTRIKTR